MKKKLLTLILLVVCAALTSFAIVSFTHETATCTGSKNCKACKNCKYCKHCAKDGGTCGVCKK